MATQILALHWKAVRIGLIPFIVAAFALPLLSIQGMGGGPDVAVDAYRAVETFQVWLPVFPLLASGLGIMLALTAWNWDHQGNHVYALSLPVARWEYALLKLGAGTVLALLPVTALLAGCLLASASVSLPAGLNAYPLELTVRFLFATLLTYSVMFALAAGTVRTAVIVMSAVFAVPIVGGVAMEFLANFFPALGQVSLAEIMYNAFVGWSGPFRIFTGNWMLIDV